MSSSKKRARNSDRIFLNVGGEVFQTTISTLTASSEFFSRKFSSEWNVLHTRLEPHSPHATALQTGLLLTRLSLADQSDAEDEIFLDRDADSFRVLLSCMRHRTALLPEGDPLLCARVLLEAQYLGVDWLLEHVKGVAYTHTRDPEEEVLETESSHISFDREHGGLDQALSSGVLPARFFGPVKTGSKRVKQMIPAGEHDAIMFDNLTNEVYRAVCYALFENERGESVIEPVVSFEDGDVTRLCLASELPDKKTWSMSEQGVRFEYAEVLATEEDINAQCEEGFCVKTVMPGRNFVLMEKRVTGF